MGFNIQECHVMHLGRNNPRFNYNLGGCQLVSVEEEKDIGVLITGNLKPGKHCEGSSDSKRHAQSNLAHL